jgi:hypothetical protein
MPRAVRQLEVSSRFHVTKPDGHPDFKPSVSGLHTTRDARTETMMVDMVQEQQVQDKLSEYLPGSNKGNKTFATFHV